MKPIKLVMSAFGSYGGEEIIDFSKIKGGLFLISGDTGSGKTTIFDGIMYALYNKMGGGDRETKMMRSEYATDKRKTFVEFTFEYAHGENKGIYIVKRTTNFRKSGVTSEVLLTLPNGEVFNGKTKETDEKIQSIVGLDYKQFGKIVMIAQGQFRELIMENTKNRKEIFKSIFSMDIYEKIERNISDRFKNVYAKIKDNNLLLEENFNTAYISEEGDNLQVWKEAFEKRDTEPELLISILEQEIKILETKKKEEKKVLDKKNEDIVKLTKKISDADKINEKFAKKREAESRYKILMEQKDTYDKKVDIVKKARAANEVKQVQMLYLKTRSSIEIKEKQLEVSSKRFCEIEKEYNDLLLEKQAFEEEYLDKSEELLRDKTRLENELEKYRLYDEKKKVYISEQNKSKIIKKKLDDINKEKEIILLKRENNKKILLELKDVEIDLQRYISEEEKNKRDLQEFEELKKAVYLYKIEKEKLEKAEKEYSKKYLIWKEARQFYDNTSDRYVAAQAAILASGLEKGKPCPVCGSINHVKLAEVTDDTVTKEELDDAKAKEDKSENQKNEAQTFFEECKRKTGIACAGVQRYYKSEVQDKIELELTDLVEIENNVNTRIAKIKKVLGEYDEKIEDLNKKKDKRFECEKIEEQIERKIAAFEEEIADTIYVYNEQCVKVGSIQAEIEILKKDLSYDTSIEALQVLDKIKSMLNSLEERKNKIEELISEDDRKKSDLNGTIKETRKQIETDKEDLKREYSDFLNAVKEKGFETEGAYNESLSYIKDIDIFEKQIQDYRENISKFNSMITVLSDVLQGEKEIDTKQMIEYKEKKQEELRLLNEENEITISRLGTNNSVKEKVTLLMEKRGKLNEQYKVISSLNNVANSKKIHFQTFVLRQYFNMVISYANKRLAVMTSNGFLLRCRDISLTSAGETGLELDVYSPVTGKVRDAHSLSGGETFMASLAMALGMSDIVQNNSGKTQIDTMFIDEGFGSLSDEVRDKAVKILLDLAGSSRLVGVISHVSELKEQIPSKIIVRKENDGSHITWVEDR